MMNLSSCSKLLVVDFWSLFKITFAHFNGFKRCALTVLVMDTETLFCTFSETKNIRENTECLVENKQIKHFFCVYNYLKDTKLHIHYSSFTVGTQHVVLYFAAALSDRSFLFPHIGHPPILDVAMLLLSLSDVEMTSQT